MRAALYARAVTCRETGYFDDDNLHRADLERLSALCQENIESESVEVALQERECRTALTADRLRIRYASTEFARHRAILRQRADPRHVK